MTLEELARHDGRAGRPAYVAVNGTIYDVTASKLWPDGHHEQQHQAGQDLTEALKAAPHVRAVVERFPAVGRLETPPPAPAKPPVKFMVLAVAVLLGLLAVVLLLR